MNEKINVLLSNARRTAIRVGDTAGDAAYGVSKKTEELLGVAKLNIQLVDLKAGVNVAMRELGELLYATHTGNPTASEVLQAKLEEVDLLKAQIAELEARLGKQKVVRCDTCGAATKKGDDFCRTCGDKLN